MLLFLRQLYSKLILKVVTMFHNILHPLRLQELSRQWLLEDTSNFDYGGGVTGERECDFVIYMKSPGILAGIPFVNAVFSELNLNPLWLYKEGTHLDSKTEIAKISGQSRKLLLAERIALNILSRASGVATSAARMCNILSNSGWKGVLAGSRKTTPGFRMVEKYALLVGGADTHRYDLSSMVMLKDNHVSIAGSIEKAVEDVRKLCGFSQKIEVECRSLEEAMSACNANCDIIMLDNFEPDDLKTAALALKLQFPNVLIEASGGINEDNILLYANHWVDIISSSSLVQGYQSVDFSMKVISLKN